MKYAKLMKVHNFSKTFKFKYFEPNSRDLGSYDIMLAFVISKITFDFMVKSI